jgi:hypothetical protein
MSTQYFSGCQTVEDVKKRYKQLAKENHPDVGGDVEVMKEINAQYQKALKGQHGSTHTGSDGKQHKYNYNETWEQEIIDKLGQLLALNMDDADIYLIGIWIWIQGETKQYKEQLKALGCRWHSKNLAWYFKPTGFKSWSSGKGLDEIANQYGARKVVRERKAIDAA